MLIVGFDTETTGLEIGDHRIIEFYGSLWEIVEGKFVKKDELNLRINPGRSIAAAAQAVHHISIQDLAGKPTWEMVAGSIHRFLEQADLLVAHNGRDFDLPFLNYEFKRVKLPALSASIFDTMQDGRWATPQGKVPNLGELCFACGIPYDPSKAHAADYDVGVMMDCFRNGLAWGFYEFPDIAENMILREAA